MIFNNVNTKSLKRKNINGDNGKEKVAKQKFSLTNSLSKNINLFKSIFSNDDTIRFREFQNSKDCSIKFCIIFYDGLVNNGIIDEFIIKPLILSENMKNDESLIDIVMNQFIHSNRVQKLNDMNKIIESVTYGETLLILENTNYILTIDTKGFVLRGITEPDAEKILYGPREGFSEGIMINLSLIRRRLRTNELKMKFKTLGESSRTAICICYMENIVKDYIIEEIEKRLDKIRVDGVLDTNYVTEYIRDAKYSPFPTIGCTERPDNVVGKLLEGRVALFMDGTPMVITLPYLFIENFQSSEDYYMDPFYNTISRILRMISFLMTITIPSFFISVISFHPEMLPAPLMINIASERKILPLPAALEAFAMLAIFDILRETGVRMPSSIGQALSIVGALVIGQAAVAAKLVSAPMIIVVAITGITSLVIPKINSSIVVTRFFLLAMSSLMGFYGLVCGLMVTLIHVLNLKTFGIPQFMPDCKIDLQNFKDVLIRKPLLKMFKRQKYLTENITRLEIVDTKENVNE
ncbi:MAG: spore germination protein [Clostridiales bacterium]|nr:spore germination protein [Clostridiales bacterium]